MLYKKLSLADFRHTTKKPPTPNIGCAIGSEGNEANGRQIYSLLSVNRLLKNAGMPPLSPDENAYSLTQRLRTIEYKIATPSVNALHNNDLHTLATYIFLQTLAKYFLSQGAMPKDQARNIIKSSSNHSPAMYFKTLNFYMAIRMQTRAEIQNLLQAGAHVNASNRRGYTALYAAIETNKVDVFKDLLTAKADMHSVIGRDHTPLQVAAEFGRTNMIPFLEESRSYKNKTPLHLAAENGHTNTAECLIEKKADLNSTTVCSPDTTRLYSLMYPGQQLPEYNLTPLHLAVKNGHTETAKLLLEKKADTCAQSSHHNTALDVARTQGHDAIASLLKITTQL